MYRRIFSCQASIFERGNTHIACSADGCSSSLLSTWRDLMHTYALCTSGSLFLFLAFQSIKRYHKVNITHSTGLHFLPHLSRTTKKWNRKESGIRFCGAETRFSHFSLIRSPPCPSHDASISLSLLLPCTRCSKAILKFYRLSLTVQKGTQRQKKSAIRCSHMVQSKAKATAAGSGESMKKRERLRVKIVLAA